MPQFGSLPSHRLACVVKTANLNDILSVGNPLEGRHFLVVHRPPLQTQGMERSGREVSQVRGVRCTQVALGVHVMTDTIDDYRGEESPKHPRPGLLVMSIVGVLHAEGAELRYEMPDVVQERGDDDLVAHPLLCGEGGRLQHVFGQVRDSPK